MRSGLVGGMRAAFPDGLGGGYLEPVLDLKEALGPSWRYKKDPAYSAEPQRTAPARVKTHLAVLECRRGGKVSGVKPNIYPYSATHLAYVGRQVGVRRELLQIPGVVSGQVGDQEFTVRFPVSLFEKVAEVVKPYRRKIARPPSKVDRAQVLGSNSGDRGLGKGEVGGTP